MKLKLGGRDRSDDYDYHLDKDPNCKPEICRDILRGIPFNDNWFDLVFSDNFIDEIRGHTDPGTFGSDVVF